MFGAYAGAAAGHDVGLHGHKFAQNLAIFIVHRGQVCHTKIALLFLLILLIIHYSIFYFLASSF